MGGLPGPIRVRHPSTERTTVQKKTQNSHSLIGKLTAFLRSQQRIVPTVEESVLRMEMTGLESQEGDAPKRVLFFKPMSWLGQIRPHRRDESWSASLWQTFVSMSMGAQIPVIAEKPLATCGCKKFQLDPWKNR